MALFAAKETEPKRNQRGRRPEPQDAPGVLQGIATGGTSPGSQSYGSVEGSVIRLKPGTVHGNVIIDGTLHATKIVAKSIEAGQIKARTITANEIKAGTIKAEHIDVEDLEANTIDARFIHADNIVAGEIKAEAIDSNAIVARHITAGEVTAGKLGAGAVIAGNVAVGAVTAGLIAAGTISTAIIKVADTGQIQALGPGNKVRATMDASGFTVYGPDGTTVWMSPTNGIRNPGIAPNAVGTLNLIDGSVTHAILAVNSVAADRIVANSIGVNQLVATAIDTMTLTGTKIRDSGVENIVMSPAGLRIKVGSSPAADASEGNRRIQFQNDLGVEQSRIVHYMSGTILGGSALRLRNYAGAVELLADGGNILLYSNKVKAFGILECGINSELRCEGSQSGIYAGLRFQAAGAGHWGGVGVTFRMRRVDGAGNIAAPSSVAVSGVLINTNCVDADITEITAYGCFMHYKAGTAGVCSWRGALSTN